MGSPPSFFFNLLFSFLGQGQGRGRKLPYTANSCWVYSERTDQQQLFLLQRNAGTTGAFFVLWAESCEGHLEVSLRLKRERHSQCQLRPAEGVPTPAHRKGFLSQAGSGSEVRPHPSSSALSRQCKKLLAFCVYFSKYLLDRRCAEQ